MVMWQPASSGCVVRNLNGDTAGGAELPNRKIRPYPSPVALPCDVLVIGAALLDVHARSRANVVHGTSNPARMMSTPGGVGRNIAENLARLGTRVSLVALVGPDDAGDRVLRETAEAGVDVSLVMTGPEPTGTYLAVLDRDGELVIALSDLTGTEGAYKPGGDRALDQAVARMPGIDAFLQQPSATAVPLSAAVDALLALAAK